MSTLRFSLLSSFLSLALVGVAVHAAEEPPASGTLSKEATAAGPAVDTSKTNVSRPASAPAESDKAAKPAGPQAVVRNDRLNLDTTVVTGNRELPKVLYIVPWKKSDLGDLPAQPFNTLLDEALTPVDRDVFRREVTYYGAISGHAEATASPPERSEK